ncbi:amino acid adenylation domain-containing protein [Nocardia mexicana]|uniref:Amino acid adenylation domain-containing protein n=1 Tax=Nocardia mexicana TaxID=279262 RepID=A0A370H9Q4_9NOCA|nr:amino acid adenylation domain-containing protein [Nocardia mexicana]RDI53405.1 amino acid adenylation domain-containing protein [Nocardia mexicana]
MGTPANLLDLLEAHVHRHPEAIACVDDSRALSYDELSRQVHDWARALRAAGVAPGDVVGIYLQPSVDLVVAVWAVLHAGAAYLPLAVDYPAERIAYMAADSGVRVVLTDTAGEARARRVLPAQVRALPVSELGDASVRAQGVRGRHDAIRRGRHHQHGEREPDPSIAALPPTAAAPSAPASDGGSARARFGDDGPTGSELAYTIYTSGTTGSPKGVLLPHRAIANQMSWLGSELALGPGTRILLKTPVSFDAAQWELLANACGATVVVAPAGTHTSPEDIRDLVVREAITVLQCVPTVWAELAAIPDIGAATTLRTVVSGGEALPTTVAARLREVLPGPRKINLYGPTEATINATWFDFTEADLTGTAVVPIGRAVDGCRTTVVDESDREVPAGQLGELLIAGIQLADGYRNRDDATAERFVTSTIGGAHELRYRTGDLVRRRTDGVLEFVGRNDEQVKVNGHRIETTEVRVWIEAHHWVRSAAVLPWVSERGVTQLAGFIELDPDEAPLMDQGRAARHHRSKSTRTQVAAQLAGLGVREFAAAPDLELAGAQPTAEQERRVFARKTYRTFTDSAVDLSTIEQLLRQLPIRGRGAAEPLEITARSLGALLRWFGPFHSPDRLLPKYSYASPGALNATQIYLETDGLPGLAPGVYYFQPLRHALYRVGSATRPGLHLHLVGLPRVIESVYVTNVREVLHFEAGHLLGVLDEVAGDNGWQVRAAAVRVVDGVTEGVVTATVAIGTGAQPVGDEPPVQAFVQVHGDASEARQGLYRFTSAGMEFVTERKIERRHVIAVNQRSYDRSALAVALTTPADAGWDGFTALGRALAHLQQLGIDARVGFMSAGYSSLTGRDLPSARRLNDIVTGTPQLSYFALAGHVSDEQLSSTGMAEDAVHMKGPEELLKDDLRAVLPPYMVPSTIQVLDRIPLSQNGKQDRTALSRLAGELNRRAARPADPPNGARESRVAGIWSRTLGYEPVYRGDDFFAQGGNSMSALRLIRTLNAELGTSLPVQAIFQTPTLVELAAATAEDASSAPPKPARLLRLAGATATATTVLWPGLGGYPMSLRALARELAQHGQAVYGMQARGLNAGERPHDNLDDLVTDDLDELLARAPAEPLRLVGYSFGARVAAEVAQRLIARGHDVEQLVLIAPGSPVIAAAGPDTGEIGYENRYFKRVLSSVFSGRTDPHYRAELDTLGSRSEFVELISAHEPGFARDTVERIVAVVEHTYRLRHQPTGVDQDLLDRSLYLRARGDGPAFADVPVAPLRLRSTPVSNLPYHHYEIVTAGALDIAAAVLEQSMNRELV